MNLFDAIFAQNPSSPAICFGRRVITYSELRAQTLRTAGIIQHLGAGAGDRVALLLT
jgi:acyl-CoA synthetase (AMP-forming)/AMP-acid ligase II